jgi:CHAT domain-containing protein
MRNGLHSLYGLIGFYVLCIFSLAAPVWADRAWQDYEQGQFESAIRAWELRLPSASGEEKIQLHSRLAAAQQALGKHRQVFLQLDQAIKYAKQHGDPAAQALIFSQFSDAWLTIGDQEAALAYAQQAVTLAESLNHSVILAHALNSLGNVWLADDASEEALTHYQRAATLVADADDLSLFFKIELNRLFALTIEEEITAILSFAQQLATQLLQQPHTQQTASFLLTYSQHLQKLLTFPHLSISDKQQVLHLLYQAAIKAHELAKELQQARLLALSYQQHALLAEQSRQFANALDYARQTVFYAHQSHSLELLYQAYWQMGRIQRKLGHVDEAIKFYQMSADILQPIQELLETGQRIVQGHFNEVVKPVYYELADLFLHKADIATQKTDKQHWLKQARSSIEQAKLAELRNYFQDDCVSTAERDYPELDQLVEHTAVIYPITLVDRLVLLVSAGEGIEVFTVSATQQDVEDQLLLLRTGLQTRPNKRYLYPSQQLYDWLIRPIRSYLEKRQVDTLVFVPDGLLRTVPMATLFDGEQFLIEQYALAITPGLTLTEPQQIDWHNARFLLAGLSEAVQNYPPLPSVPKELQRISEVTPHATVLLDKNFSLENLQGQLRATEFTAIHLATHGEFSADPQQTYLLNYHDKITIDRLQTVIGLGNFRKQPIELLTLSACQTAVGDDKAALGLAGIAVKAGARSAIATLWFVDDEATALAMTQFYQTLLDPAGSSKAKALQQVQMQLLRHPRYQHPAYWGPFLLIGNWL